MPVTLQSACTWGIEAFEIRVEVDIATGLPQFIVVGLPDTSIKESRERVRAAIKNSNFPFPQDKITINLAPADFKKEGSDFDLPIALGILAAQGILAPEKLHNYVILGELALSGEVQPVKGCAIMASTFSNTKTLLLPSKNAQECSFVRQTPIYPIRTLKEAVQFINGEIQISPIPTTTFNPETPIPRSLDFSEVKGQRFAKRAIEIAVAGGHNLAMLGPPGAGKTMLARRIPSILPPLTFDEALEITKIHSAAGILRTHLGLIAERPFRAPHHTASAVALVGGGASATPGEVSLAHGGVLFLDEFPEFRRDVIESLRNPVEDGLITVSRAKIRLTYPSRFMLVAAMNPCPCGHLSDPKKPCRCSMAQILKYQNKISGPIMDRIDLHIEVPNLSYQHLIDKTLEEPSIKIRERIMACRNRQKERFHGIRLNSTMSPSEIKAFVPLGAESSQLLEAAMKELRLSARAYFKILKIARTIADLDHSEGIQPQHIAEAIQYRSLDRQWRT